MRIGIDARLWGPYGRGVGRYVENLIKNLEKIDRKNEYVIFLREQNFGLYQPRNKKFSKVLLDVPWYTAREQAVLPSFFSAQRLDLLHVPHFNVPILYSGKTVSTIHDLTMLKFGGKRTTTRSLPVYLLKRSGLQAILGAAARKSAAVITPSKFVRDEVVQTFGISPKKVSVTYEAGVLAGKERTPQEKQVERVLGKYKIVPPYFLYVGGFYPHKNLDRLLRAVKLLNEELGKEAELVMVGSEDDFRKKLMQQALEIGALKYLVFTGYVTDADLVDLYQKSEALVQPSLSEGFGLPTVEAMSLGTPVVQSETSCLPEIAGKAALYFDPYKPRDMAEKMGKILGSKSLRSRLSKAGLKRSEDYSWEKMAKETLKVYEKAAKE